MSSRPSSPSSSSSYTSSSTSLSPPTFQSLHHTLPTQRYLTVVPPAYISDTFNLYGLRNLVGGGFQDAIDVILGGGDCPIIDEQEMGIKWGGRYGIDRLYDKQQSAKKSASIATSSQFRYNKISSLYSLIHARYVVSPQGIQNVAQG
eukprot:CAMPEP_0118644458 /NCGR_PEP_ID=MMETSP0785-20121206/6958_1 /TAXON_ID=91992 /ORGANISM="Bolidomonas pacifica, Strain CCMP 1866" /LENGTH=146 /DNA_ID=CAMNT_0006536235 /DNA_START=329 /DNA_END=765 /DNA_ORIENTATION=+